MSMSDIAEGFIKHTEQTFGAAHPTREKVKNARRIVVKVRLVQHPSAPMFMQDICAWLHAYKHTNCFAGRHGSCYSWQGSEAGLGQAGCIGRAVGSPCQKWQANDSSLIWSGQRGSTETQAVANPEQQPSGDADLWTSNSMQ